MENKKLRVSNRIAFVNDLVTHHSYVLAGLTDDGDMVLCNSENHCMIKVDERKAVCISGHGEDSTVFLWFEDMTVAGDGDRHYTAGSRWGFDIREGRPCWNNYFAKEA